MGKWRVCWVRRLKIIKLCLRTHLELNTNPLLETFLQRQAVVVLLKELLLLKTLIIGLRRKFAVEGFCLGWLSMVWWA